MNHGSIRSDHHNKAMFGNRSVLSLNELDDPKFRVTQKSVRDHYNLLEKQQKKRMRDEKKASGISPVHNDFEDGMENIM